MPRCSTPKVMIRSIGALLAGLAAWVVFVSLLDRALRMGIPGYAVVEPALQLTLAMKLARRCCSDSGWRAFALPEGPSSRRTRMRPHGSGASVSGPV